jgi:uncharacterized protein
MTTLVIGASTNPDRYSYKAIKSLLQHNQHVVAIGAKPGEVGGVQFVTNQFLFDQIDTITLYINPTVQQDYIHYILDLKPRRVIFNPGTENEDFQTLLQQHNIIAQEACTLVLLSIGAY